MDVNGKPEENAIHGVHGAASLQRAQALIQEIAACVRQLDLARARIFFSQLQGITDHPATLAPAQFSLGLIEQRSGNPRAAIELYSLALDADNRNPALTLQLGLAHFALAQIDDAERCYRAAIKLEPRMAHAHYNLGVLLQQKRDLAGACRAFDAALLHQPRFTEALNNLGNVLMALHDFSRAEKCYRDAIAINEKFFFAHHGLGVLLIETNRHNEALISLRAALKYDPANLDVWLELAECERQTGDLNAAKKTVDVVLAQDAHHTVANFRRTLYAGEPVESIPPEFVTRMYANMSATFDEHLVNRLGYRTPELIKTSLEPWLNQFSATHATKPRVIDLGCGTGLFGVEIRASAAHLVGVDLSTHMLAAARTRGIYDELVECDVTSFLNERRDGIDLITATDVLIYVGTLEPLFAAVARRLSAGGAFAFSIETPDDLVDGFRIQTTGRFAHSAHYVDTLATHSLRVMARERTIIRSEAAEPVKGYLFVLGKN